MSNIETFFKMVFKNRKQKLHMQCIHYIFNSSASTDAMVSFLNFALFYDFQICKQYLVFLFTSGNGPGCGAN